MIVYDLKCEAGHTFEAWFKSSGEFKTQARLGEIECPACGSARVGKALTAPNVGAKGNRRGARAAHPRGEQAEGANRLGYGRIPPKLRHELDHVLGKIRRHVEETCEYVGEDFPDEARKIHYGEADERGIYGEASVEESLDLLDEGIDVIPLPGPAKRGPEDA